MDMISRRGESMFLVMLYGDMGSSFVYNGGMEAHTQLIAEILEQVF